MTCEVGAPWVNTRIPCDWQLDSRTADKSSHLSTSSSKHFNYPIMTSIKQAEKVFFDPRLRVERPPAGGSSMLSRQQLSRSVDSLGSLVDTGLGFQGRRPSQQPGRQDRRGSIRQLRRVLRGKVSRSRDHLPLIDRDTTGFIGLGKSRPFLKKAGSVTSVLDTSLPKVAVSSKLYSSQPLLNRLDTHRNSTMKQDTIEGTPVVAEDKAKMKSLPNIPFGQLKFGNDLLGEVESYGVDDGDDFSAINEFEVNSNGIDKSNVGASDECASDDDNEIVKMLKEHKLDEANAQRDVESNWVLQNEIDKMNKKFERRKKRLKINISDEDPMVVIEKRLLEVKQMTKPKRDQRHVLARFSPEVRDLILKYKDIPASEIRKRHRKKGEQLVDRFRHVVSIIRLLLRGLRGTTRYYMDNANVNQLRKKIETLVEHTSSVPMGRASISPDMQIALTTPPQHRNKAHIKQILWILRATKAFKHLFPAEMEDEVARMVAYERYDDGRIIAYQSRTPDRFYYVLSGRVNLIRQYKLSTGQVTKSMGFLTKGRTTDPQEVDQQWMREESMVSKGQVEVLIIDKKPFSALQHTTDGPPIDFIQALHLFLEFPCERFRDSPDSIEVKYYGQGKVIIKDSNRTPWLHVVKSGLVKVVRRQSVIDTRLANESKFSAPTLEHLGCGKAFSHAQAMLGVQAKQKKTKASSGTTILPQIDRHKHCLVAKGLDNFSTFSTKSKSKPHRSKGTKSIQFAPGKGTYIQTGVIDNIVDTNPNPFQGTLGVRNPVVFKQPQTSQSPSPEGYDEDSLNEKNRRRNSTSPQGSRTMSTIADDPEKDGEESFEPHSLWLTREKTSAGQPESVYASRHRRDPVYNRRAYLQLDTLRPGDVFGLDHLQPALASEPVGVSLLSDGAEVIKINKRFFLQNAANNTMLKVETMYKSYLPEEEAQDVIYHKETWRQYKSAVMDRMTAPSPIASASKR